MLESYRERLEGEREVIKKEIERIEARKEEMKKLADEGTTSTVEARIAPMPFWGPTPFWPSISPEQERLMLEQQAEALEKQIEAIKKHIEELRKGD